MADVQDLFRRYANAIAELDWPTLETIIHPDFVMDYPQSGERFRGFAAFKKHIGVYPPVRDAKLRKELARYAGPKGNLQFPLSERIPYALIGRVAKVRTKENAARARAKR